MAPNSAPTAPRPMRRRLPAVIVLAVALSFTPGSRGQAVGALDAVIANLETIVQRGDPAAFGSLLAPQADLDKAAAFAIELIRPGATRVVLRERDRAPLDSVAEGRGFRILIEVFVEHGRSARIMTASLDLVLIDTPDASTETAWRIADQQRVSSLDGLYRLQLDLSRQFDVSGLVVTDEDFSVTVSQGSAFVAEAGGGPTAIVLVGDGTMRFAPSPAAERGQLRVLGGRDVLERPFRAVFLRLSPANLDNHLERARLKPRAVNPRDLQQAQEIFAEEVNKSFTLDLSDLSRDPWSLVPTYGDFLAEVHTRKQDTLTYTRSAHEAEDISLFNRRLRRNISVYASARKLRERGPSYSEDELADYDVLDYLVEVSYDPVRQWLDGHTRLRVRARQFLPLMTLRLAESLVPRSVVSNRHGRLLALRVKGQNSVILNFPAPLKEGDTIDLAVVYSGRIEPQPVDREVISLGAEQPAAVQVEEPVLVPEARYTFTNRSYWYPQNTVTDYATATIRVTVPSDLECVASGDPSTSNPTRVAAPVPGGVERARYEFVAGQPLRYLAFVVSNFTPAVSDTVRVPSRAADDAASDSAARSQIGIRYDSLDLFVTANPRQASRSRVLAQQVGDILSFYAGLVDDLPYPTFTLAVVDSELPGGHSPAYFALLNQPLPTTPYFWRSDPVAFNNFPSFYVAHELAHQHWGQAVGWENYHEQWLSEGFAQFFALLYAEHSGGPAAVRGVLRQMQRSVLSHADQGPIALGYRLGHIKGDSRTFRAIVYNKGAMVLHMLRRLLGDDVFFRGLREFYHESRFTKVGTGDARRAFERVAGRSLESFFRLWIEEAEIPLLSFQWQVEGSEVHLRFEQQGSVFEVPVTVTLTYASGNTEEVIVPVTERVSDLRVPAKGALRSVKANEDRGALVQLR